MNIGFDAKRAFHNYTGLGNYSRFIIEALQEYHPEHIYYLYTPKKSINKEVATISKSKIIEVPTAFKLVKSLWRSLFLFQTISSTELQIFHGLSNELPAWGGNQIKKVVTIHDLIFLRYPGLYNAIDRMIYTWKFKGACKKADLIIAISEQTKADIIDFFNVDEDKIKVVYQGHHEVFNSEYSKVQLQQIKAKYQLPDKYMLSVGTVEKRKNALLILKAMATMSNPLPLVIVGKATDYKKELLTFIAQHNLASRVHFLHHAAFSDLPALYQMSEVFIYPSIFEGFGIPIIEAQRCGVPVITSTGSCFKEAGGEAARYVSSSDPEALARQIEEIMSNKDLRNEMVASGKDHLKKFSKQKIAKDLNDIYSGLLAN